MQFFKYQGTGNDFVMIDNRTTEHLNRQAIEKIRLLCHRKFGIGADGLILLQNHPDYDFEMVYFNADGNESTMCGNGGRCIVAFAKQLGIIQHSCSFLAIDGPHEARINAEGDWVELKMGDVNTIEKNDNFYYLNTGSPHYVRFVDSLEGFDVFEEGRAVRYSERFKTEGTNVNFVAPNKKGIEVATYERGVEDETLSCGTGVTAAALTHYLQQKENPAHQIAIQSKGGSLEVRFTPHEAGFTDIWLCGAANLVFEGLVDL